MCTDTSIYGRAVAEAREELNSLRQQSDRLNRRMAQLEAFIANAEPLLPEAKKLPTLFPTAPTQAAHIDEPATASVPIWKGIVLSINGKSGGFTVKDALEGLDRIGRSLTSPNKVQIVRNILTQKDDVFEKIAAGVFAVKKPAEGEEARAAI